MSPIRAGLSTYPAVQFSGATSRWSRAESFAYRSKCSKERQYCNAIVGLPSQDSTPRNPDSGAASNSRSRRGMASATGSHLWIFQKRLMRIPMRKTTTSPSTCAVNRSAITLAMGTEVCGRLTSKVTGAPRRCSRERKNVPARPVHRLVRPHTTSFCHSARRSQDARRDSAQGLYTATTAYRGHCTKHASARPHGKKSASLRTEKTQNARLLQLCELTDAVQPLYACGGRSARARRANATHGVMLVL
jgi:hypothetical protein